jgi:DNA-binding Xre family transcriptional regulator
MSQHSKHVERVNRAQATLTASRRADVAFLFRSLMVAAELKNVDLANRLGVSEANVSRWLRGNQNLSLDTMHAICDALDAHLILDVRSGLESVTELENWEPAPVGTMCVYDLCAYRELRQSKNRNTGTLFAKPMSELEQDHGKESHEPAVAVG